MKCFNIAVDEKGAGQLTICASILFALLFTVCNALATFENGVDAFMRGDYRGAHKEWLPLARSGDADAARNLARLYQEGLGITRDYAEARRWYEVAAKKCNATAQNNFALMILNEQGGPQDPVRAFRLFESAANQGIHADSDAMGNLAGMYLSGVGTQTNVIEAYKWYVLYSEFTTDPKNRRRVQELLPQVERTMPQRQKSEALKRASSFQRKRCVPG